MAVRPAAPKRIGDGKPVGIGRAVVVPGRFGSNRIML
jgi:hypothetical protein